MVEGDLFDKLARIGSLLRKDARPFGGIQVRDSSVRVNDIAITRCLQFSTIAYRHWRLLPASSSGEVRFKSQVRVRC